MAIRIEPLRPCRRGRSLLLALAAATGLGTGDLAFGADLSDPFSVRSLAARSQLGNIDAGETRLPCRFEQPERTPMSLADVIDRALCNNPQTRAAWASARAQAAQVGVARASFFPSVSATVSGDRNRSSGGVRVGTTSINNATTYNEESAGLSASWLLYDFGARDATLRNALSTLAASNFTQDATLQKVFLSAVQAYYNLFATRAAVDSAAEAERSALASLKAAAARYEAGTGIPADRLQAQTAYSQAVLNRIQAAGNAKNAEGVVANVMGLDANRPLVLSAPATRLPDEQSDKDIGDLIETARKRRPDLAAAEAQIKAAQATVDAARASAMLHSVPCRPPSAAQAGTGLRGPQ